MVDNRGRPQTETGAFRARPPSSSADVVVMERQYWSSSLESSKGMFRRRVIYINI